MENLLDARVIGGILIIFSALLIAYEVFVSGPRRPLARRLAYLENLRDRIAGRITGEAEEDLGMAGAERLAALGDLVVSGLRFLSGTFGTLVMFSKKDQEKMRQNLVYAGMHSSDALNLLFTAKAVSALAGVILIVAVNFSPLADGIDSIAYWIFAIPVVIFFAAIPEKVIVSKAERRQAAIAASLPDALDLMIICTNAGYSLDLTIARVARDIRSFAKDMSDELHITAGELRVLADRRDAFDNLLRRTDVAGIRSVVGSLNQAQRYGTPISQALRNTAAELRAHNLLAIEEWAATIPAKMTGPIVVLILPSVFLIVAGPSFIQILRSL